MFLLISYHSIILASCIEIPNTGIHLSRDGGYYFRNLDVVKIVTKLIVQLTFTRSFCVVSSLYISSNLYNINIILQGLRLSYLDLVLKSQFSIKSLVVKTWWSGQSKRRVYLILFSAFNNSDLNFLEKKTMEQWE